MAHLKKMLSMVEMKRLMTRLRPGASGMTNRFRHVKPPCKHEARKGFLVLVIRPSAAHNAERQRLPARCG